jgi:hypothetical protein
MLRGYWGIAVAVCASFFICGAGIFSIIHMTNPNRWKFVFAASLIGIAIGVWAMYLSDEANRHSETHSGRILFGLAAISATVGVCLAGYSGFGWFLFESFRLDW